MRRGDLVTIAVQGDFGKPRPALVIQADLFGDHASLTVLPVTSTLVAAPLLRVMVGYSGHVKPAFRSMGSQRSGAWEASGGDPVGGGG